MKKKDEREREEKFIEQPEEEKIQRESPSIGSFSTDEIEIEHFSPHTRFLLIDSYFSILRSFPSK
jgi:hypothetical protein